MGLPPTAVTVLWLLVILLGFNVDGRFNKVDVFILDNEFAMRDIQGRLDTIERRLNGLIDREHERG
jgi:hypothetical protein